MALGSTWSTWRTSGGAQGGGSGKSVGGERVGERARQRARRRRVAAGRAHLQSLGVVDVAHNHVRPCLTRQRSDPDRLPPQPARDAGDLLDGICGACRHAAERAHFARRPASQTLPTICLLALGSGSARSAASLAPQPAETSGGASEATPGAHGALLMRTGAPALKQLAPSPRITREARRAPAASRCSKLSVQITCQKEAL